MKKIFILLAFAAFGIAVHAQDTTKMRNPKMDSTGQKKWKHDKKKKDHREQHDSITRSWPDSMRRPD